MGKVPTMIATSALESVLAYLRQENAPEDIAATVEQLINERKAANEASRAKRSARSAEKYDKLAEEIVARRLLPAEGIINADVRRAVEEVTECAASSASATRVIASLLKLGAVVPSDPLKGYAGKCYKLAA